MSAAQDEILELMHVDKELYSAKAFKRRLEAMRGAEPPRFDELMGRMPRDAD
jgi:hypothetical protein